MIDKVTSQLKRYNNQFTVTTIQVPAWPGAINELFISSFVARNRRRIKSIWRFCRQFSENKRKAGQDDLELIKQGKDINTVLDMPSFD
jgi:hypothetical protein